MRIVFVFFVLERLPRCLLIIWCGNLLKETQLIRSSLIESLTREAKPYVQKRPNSRLEKVDTFPKKDKGRPDGGTCYHGEPEMLVVWFSWVKVK